MRRTIGPASRPGEEGFTLLETLVAMVVLSALGVGAWVAVAVAWRSVERIRAGSRAGAEVLRLDDRLRACAGRVRPPWWGGEPALETGGGEPALEAGSAWRIACLDGDPGKFLILSWRDGVLSIDDGAIITRHTGFADVGCSPALDGTGASFGVERDLAAAPLGRFAIVARYGGRPLMSGFP